jgi:signal transduction histidine kinase
VTSRIRNVSGAYYGFAAFMLTLGVVAVSGLGPGMAATEKLLPHGFCYLWDPGLMRLHIVSDALIGLAYIAIPISLLSFMRRRADLPFNWMFLLFGVFIVACGATHLMELWTLWNPDYWLAGSVKAITAAASVPTAILLFMLVPRAVALPSTRQLQEAKDALEMEVVERRRVESELRQAHAPLEVRVQERTTDLQKANDQLERQSARLKESDREKDEFLAILSHELRNPVHAIRMGVGVLKISSSDPEIQQTCSSLERQVSNISRLLNDLLSVLTQKRGGLQLKTSPTDIREVIGAAVETASALIGHRGQRLDVQLPEEPVTVEADSGRLVQALTNLLSNASSYSNPGTAIRLEAALNEGEIRIAVTDSGIGFNPEEATRLFELFSRGARARSHFAGGLGIGLHVSREIVAAHGGRIRADSEGTDKGSRFQVWLPVIREPDRS